MLFVVGVITSKRNDDSSESRLLLTKYVANHCLASHNIARASVEYVKFWTCNDLYSYSSRHTPLENTASALALYGLLDLQFS